VNLRATHGVDDEHREVGHGERSVGVAGEVGVAGRVDQVDPVVSPGEGREAKRERLAAGTFLGVAVEHGVAVLDPSHAVDDSRGRQHRLGERGLAVPLVAHQRDVPDLVGRDVDAHGVGKPRTRSTRRQHRR
jgi:hypothetical protein